MVFTKSECFIQHVDTEHWLWTSAITPNSHYHVVYTYQLENCEYGFLLMAKITQAVWLHRDASTAATLISLVLPSSCPKKGKENRTKVCLRADNKIQSNTRSRDWVPFIVDNPLAHTHTHTQMNATPAVSTNTHKQIWPFCDTYHIGWHLIKAHTHTHTYTPSCLNTLSTIIQLTDAESEGHW